MGNNGGRRNSKAPWESHTNTMSTNNTNEATTSTETNMTAKPCKMGCGFFGSSATNGCCSSCWRSHQEKKNPTAVSPKKRRQEDDESTDASPKKRTKLNTAESKELTTKPLSPLPTKKATKKKKKKFSSILSGMLKKSQPRDADKEKELLRKELGGGVFSKI